MAKSKLHASQSLPVQHRADESRFVIATPNGEAELLYRLTGQPATGDGLSGARIDFYRTFVQPADRGKHLARVLVDAGLAWAREQHFEISASCWYVAKVLQQQHSGE